ncbi:hypothetical protein Hanom_Chr08g00736651 [Helianthus anomalus]
MFRFRVSGFLLGKSDPIIEPIKVWVGRVRVFRVFANSGSGDLNSCQVSGFR